MLARQNTTCLLLFALFVGYIRIDESIYINALRNATLIFKKKYTYTLNNKNKNAPNRHD